MTNVDPGGLLLLLTVIPSVVAGISSIGLSAVAARLGYGDYETNVAVIVGILIVAWVVASLVIEPGLLRILAVTLSMVGAYAVTRSVSVASYGWVLGVVMLFAAFTALSVVGIYDGVDQSGRPQGLIASHFFWFYVVGLFAGGAVGGKAGQLFARGWRARFD